MEKILISFIGNNDCLLSENKQGAIISILHELEFDKVYLIYSHSKYLPFASEILLYCRRHFPLLKVLYEAALAIDPTDHNIVYPAMYKTVSTIMSKETNAQFTVSITSGTPTMHACWLLLKQGGLISAKLIQNSREKGISEVTFDLDDFPKIESDKVIKANLTKMSRENAYLKEKLNLDFDEIVGQHPLIIKVKEQISKLCRYDLPVYIKGESGTGKELVARAIHYNSMRKEKPFIAVNCGAISYNLFESEFFGHKKGAFTGAISDHTGYFLDADKGSLFLDEIGDLPLNMQVKLLRVLESNEIQPVGGKKVKVNIRLICASHKNLLDMVNEGTFREDLYYRIVQGIIKLPSLRERGTDILLIAQKFLHQINYKEKINKYLDKSAERKLMSYHWKGNIRELKNILHISWINTCNEIITSEDVYLPEIEILTNEVYIPDEGIDLKKIISLYYKTAMKKANGNASRAARLLNIDPHTFRARLKTIIKSKNNNHEK